MKVKLEFDLTVDGSKYKRALKADEMYAVLWDFAEELRRRCKYCEYTDDAVLSEVEDIRSTLHDMLQDYGVDFYDLEHS